MAKRKNTDEQLALIDCDPEEAKKIKAAIRTYNKYGNEKNDAKHKEDEWREKILSLVREAGGKPDAEGTIRIKVGEAVITIKQGAAKLKIDEEGASDELDEGDDDGELVGAGKGGKDFEGDEPASVSRKKKD